VIEMAALASVAEVADYPGDEFIIKEESSRDTMYLITQGEVSVVRQGEEGGPEVELDRLGPGDIVGEMAFFVDSIHTESARSVAQCRLMVFHKKEFIEVVREYPQIGLHLCKVFSGRLRKIREKAESGEH
jgi:CRP/FNR family cyclic AMP-dependent transcriptional regulator